VTDTRYLHRNPALNDQTVYCTGGNQEATTRPFLMIYAEQTRPSIEAEETAMVMIFTG